jgi:hypothetical protein
VHLRKSALIVVLPAVASACASSVLIRPDDQTFARSERHLVATRAYVENLKPTPAEAAIVVQAEGLYRYRFDPPARGFTSYAAEFAASAIEIPALQSMSGALDIFDLRLRMSDGAVQLWETYLSRYPAGALRPLVLYRLGWAYRSTEAAGLPRQSGDEAFAQLRREYPGSPLSALAADAHGLAWKSKDAATGWSVVPGLGQMYVGAYGQGSVHLLVALAAVTMMVAPAVVAYERRHDLAWGDDWPLLVVGVGGLLVLSLDYTVAYQDAIKRVVEWNDRVENAFEDAHPEAP